MIHESLLLVTLFSILCFHQNSHPCFLGFLFQSRLWRRNDSSWQQIDSHQTGPFCQRSDRISCNMLWLPCYLWNIAATHPPNLNLSLFSTNQMSSKSTTTKTEKYTQAFQKKIFHSPKSSKRIHSCLCHHGPISIFQSHSLHISTSRLKQKISASNPVIHVGCVVKKEWHRPVSNKPPTPKILEPMINSQAQKS